MNTSKATAHSRLTEWLDGHRARHMWTVRPEKRHQTVSLYVIGPSTCIVTEFDGGGFDIYTSLGTLEISETFSDAETRMDVREVR